MKFRGTVIEGYQVGNPFGIATANLEVEKDLDLKEGVYFVEVTVGFDPTNKTSSEIDKYGGLLHIGQRKTFGSEFSIEVHILNFDQDLYTKEITVEVLQYLRPTKRFQNADALFTQIETDIVMAEKFFMRRAIKHEWAIVNDVWKKEASEKAATQVSALDSFQDSEVILAYAPQSGREIEFVELLMNRFPKKKWYFPVVEGEEMKFYLVERWQDLESGKYGIKQPSNRITEQPNNKLDSHQTSARDRRPILIFVPAVAVDRNGNRLGRGGGYYDQFLSDFFSPCEGGVRGGFEMLSVMPSFAVLEKIPTEDHDQLVRTLIIE